MPQDWPFCKGVQEQTTAAISYWFYLSRANVIWMSSEDDTCFQLYNVCEAKTVPAPTIAIQVTSSTGTKTIEVLPDSGVDVSAADQKTLSILGHHVDNLLPASVSPRAVNGTTLIPWGKIPVTLQLGRWTCEHLPNSIRCFSWKAAKALHILPHLPSRLGTL